MVIGKIIPRELPIISLENGLVLNAVDIGGGCRFNEKAKSCGEKNCPFSKRESNDDGTSGCRDPKPNKEPKSLSW